VFAHTHERIAKILEDYEGDISFATDAWTSPNHYAYVALTAHLQAQGQLLSIILNIVEVPKVHETIHVALNHANMVGSRTLGSTLLRLL
jgi:hypothetical protein